ncbi:MAG: efflux RND transporter periplasmic adaptor subunit [Pirellulales bacterium]
MRHSFTHRQFGRAVSLGLAWMLLSAPGCNRSPAVVDATGAPAKAGVPKQVVVAHAQLQPWPTTLRVQGSLLADEDALIGTKIAGRVETVTVDLGSIVKQGQPMVTLDRRELELLVAQAEAELQQACAAIGMTPQEDETKLDYKGSPPVMLEQALVDEAQAAMKRGEQLLPNKALSRGEYDTLVAQLKTAQARYLSALNGVSEQVSLIGVRRANLDLARQHLTDAQIVAPFDAVLSMRHVAPGEYVQTGSPLVTLVRADRLRFTAGVPESKAAGIAIGQKVEISVAGRTQPIEAAISRVSPIVILSSRSMRIEADVANPQLELQPGLFGEAEIIVDSEAKALAVPAAAVSQFAGVQKVWLVTDGQAKQQTVRTGRTAADRVEILEGLVGGESVVANAAEGHAGPVVAIDAPAHVGLQAHIPDPESVAPVYE